MTVMELMIVLAIIGGGVFLMRTGFRKITKADLVENATELSAIMKRAGQLAVERGEMHRVLIDMDKGIYIVEVCQGQATLQKNEAVRTDEEKAKRALEKGNERLRGVPTDSIAADAEEATKHAMAIAGHHIADRMCMPLDDNKERSLMSGATGAKDARTNQEWVRALATEKGIKFKEIWVQHKDDSTTKGQVAVYFFPTGTAEKAVIEVTDDSETFSILVHGLTSRVQLRDGTLRDVNDHMLRNVMGDKEKERDGEAAKE
jgi:hypothetical protein